VGVKKEGLLMSDFRQAQAPTPAFESPKPPDVKVGGESSIEVPFLDYRSEHKKSFCADFFELGDMGNESVYDDDIGEIEGYLKEQIESGKMDNSTQSAKDKLKAMEKLVGYDKTERTVVKMAKLSAYVKFLRDIDNIESHSTKYGR
jgi:hypothetical protein